MDVSKDRAMFIAAEVREMIDVIYKFNCVVDPDELLAAWGYLTAAERTAYKEALKAGLR